MGPVEIGIVDPAVGGSLGYHDLQRSDVVSYGIIVEENLRGELPAGKVIRLIQRIRRGGDNGYQDAHGHCYQGENSHVISGNMYMIK
jgi:hypothetical protein